MDDSIIQQLRATIHGTILCPGDDGYDEARIIHNGMIDKRPEAIVRCTGTADVIDSVNIARENDLLVAVRGDRAIIGRARSGYCRVTRVLLRGCRAYGYIGRPIRRPASGDTRNIWHLFLSAAKAWQAGSVPRLPAGSPARRALIFI